MTTHQLKRRIAIWISVFLLIATVACCLRIRSHYNLLRVKLARAAMHGKVGAVEHLILRDADIDESKALFCAALFGHLNVIRCLLDHGADPNNQDSTGRSALMVAAEKGYTEIVALLLERGVIVNLRDPAGREALCYARRGGNAEILRMLTQAGGHCHERMATANHR